jgi:hypothetical protein
MFILNLTQHLGTPEQDVTEPKNKKFIQELLTFSKLPSASEIDFRVSALVAECCAWRSGLLQSIASATACSDAVPMTEWEIVERMRPSVMIGGAPYLMFPLHQALIMGGFRPVYAYSERVSVEDPETGVKTSVFKHMGFVG